MEEGKLFLGNLCSREIFLCYIKDLYLYNERDRDMYTQLCKLTKILNCENTFRMFLATFARKAIEIYVNSPELRILFFDAFYFDI